MSRLRPPRGCFCRGHHWRFLHWLRSSRPARQRRASSRPHRDHPRVSCRWDHFYRQQWRRKARKSLSSTSILLFWKDFDDQQNLLCRTFSVLPLYMGERMLGVRVAPSIAKREKAPISGTPYSFCLLGGEKPFSWRSHGNSGSTIRSRTKTHGSNEYYDFYPKVASYQDLKRNDPQQDDLWIASCPPWDFKSQIKRKHVVWADIKMQMSELLQMSNAHIYVVKWS